MGFLSETYKKRLQELAEIKEILSPNEIANREFVKQFGEMPLLQSSNRGLIYRSGPGIVTKATVDETEYENAKKFIGNPHKNFIIYYSAEPWMELSGKNWYILKMEEIKPLYGADWEIVDLINNTLGLQEYMLSDQRRMSFIGELKRNPEWYEDFASYKDMISTLSDMHNMYKEAQKRGIVLSDARSQNFGRTTDGRLVHFDMGAG